MSDEANVSNLLPPDEEIDLSSPAATEPEPDKEVQESILSKEAIEVIKGNIAVIQNSVLQIQKILTGGHDEEFISPIVKDMHKKISQAVSPFGGHQDAKTIEGVFDGQGMVGADGAKYVVPANYASKSKLVEGDILKLNITDDGTFIYKQIAPTDRDRLVGELFQDTETGDYSVKSQGKKYKVLTASITYFKGEAGDEAVILVPKNSDSHWAAVENVIKKSKTKKESDGSLSADGQI